MGMLKKVVLVVLSALAIFYLMIAIPIYLQHPGFFFDIKIQMAMLRGFCYAIWDFIVTGLGG